jgi:hypothetical protein
MLQQLWNHEGSSYAPRAEARRRVALRPIIVCLEDRLTLSTTLGSSFTGLASTGWYPPDTNAAVGPNHVVETVNETLAIYNKSTGAFVSSQTLPSLFSGFDTGGNSGTFDPSVMYDEQAGRFVVVDMVNDSANHKAYIDLAVSNSSDPTAGFAEKQQIEVDEGGANWVDNGKLGSNADAYVFTGNSYSFAGTYQHEMVITINKSSVLDQNPGTFTDYQVTRSGNFSMIPARMHGSTSGGPMWFVETSTGGGSSIDVVKMTNVLSGSPSFTDSNLTVNSYGYKTSAVQPGGTVGIVDARTLNAEWNNNNLVAGWDSTSGSDSAAGWVEFNTSGSSPTKSQQGVIHPASGVQTYFPAVTVDSSGNMAMTYMESSSSEYVSAYFTGRLAADPANTMEPATLMHGGGASLSPNRAGDYAGIAIDPSAAATFWAANEYAQSNGSWSTWLSQFTVGGGTGNQPPTVATPATANPNPVTATTTALGVLGADDGGESNLTYNWSVTAQPSGVTSPSFSINGTNAAKNSTATFYAAGTYTFQATITDSGGLSTSSSVNVTVNQTLSSVGVTPGGVTLASGGTQLFTASSLDQFGRAMANQPGFTWTVDTGGVGGTVGGSGLYTAPSSGTGTDTVRATGGGLNGTAAVTVAATPNPPSNLVAAAGRRQVGLRWTDNSSNETGFKIQRSPNGSSSWTQIATVGANVTTYTDAGLRRGQTYYYRVAAYNASGTSAWSNVASATSNAPGTATPGSGQSLPAPDSPLYVNSKNLKRWQRYHKNQREQDPGDRPVLTPRSSKHTAAVRIRSVTYHGA